MRVFEAGQIYRIGRAYRGNGHFEADSSTGHVVRLLRPMKIGAAAGVDWYVTTDLHGGEEADWTLIVHESRLRTSLRVRADAGYLPGQEPYTAEELRRVQRVIQMACDAEEGMDRLLGAADPGEHLNELERAENALFR